MLSKNFIEPFLGAHQVLGSQFNICGLTGQAIAADQRLVNEYFTVGQCYALALGATGKQERTHAGGHTHTDGGHIALDVIHRVVNRQTGSYGATGAVDIQTDVFLTVLALQKQQLGHHQRSGGVVHLVREHDNTVAEQAGINIHGALAGAGLLYNIRD